MPEDSGNAKQNLVPDARFDSAYLNDLTTAGTQLTGHTNIIDWFGLHAGETRNPRNVPGLQIDGYFLDGESKTTRAPGNLYGNKRLPFDSQFVIRFPTAWNGKLVITGAPGIRGQYANDFMISDFVLKKGYAFASTDKGNSGLRFYSAGAISPGSFGGRMAPAHQAAYGGRQRCSRKVLRRGTVSYVHHRNFQCRVPNSFCFRETP